jgi:hypothetical protein
MTRKSTKLQFESQGEVLLDEPSQTQPSPCRNVRGMFAKPSGNVTLDEAMPANSRVDATSPRAIGEHGRH